MPPQMPAPPAAIASPTGQSAVARRLRLISGLVLFFFTLILNTIALKLVRKYREQYD